jgi:hypothetical protein
VSLRVYDVRGRPVKTLFDGLSEPGRHRVQWEGSTNWEVQAAPGIYFCRMETGSYRSTKKVVLLK